MVVQVQVKEFDWASELHQTMVKSLTTTFGLDFLLFEDKRGGDVDTVHKVREYQKELQQNGKTDIHVSQKLSSKLTADGRNADKYDSHAYHTDSRYIERGRADKKLQQSSELHDEYRQQQMAINENRQLDHKISASEIHHDAGRILAELDDVELANQETNFQSTKAYINTKKSDMPIQEFIQKLPEMKKAKQEAILQNQKKLETMSETMSEHEKRKLIDKIKKEKEHLADLESVDEQAMLDADKVARTAYNNGINLKYYTSSKFFGSAAMDMGKKGLTMGLRQSVGLVLAEIWFELREQIPQIYQKCKQKFQLSTFIEDIKQSFENIWERVKVRFKDLLSAFKDGLISGIIASITTTIWNAFQTIGGNAIKLIRETWSSLIQAVKLIFFNPEKLQTGDLIREVTRIVGTAASVAVGTWLHGTLESSLPFGLAEFVSAFISGVLTIGLNYFLDHSEMMQKVWHYLNNLKSQYVKILEYYQEINAELDRYLLELSQVEFNMNPFELQQFANELAVANDEYQRRYVLNKEINHRNIELPFQDGCMKDWLKEKYFKNNGKQ